MKRSHALLLIIRQDSAFATDVSGSNLFLAALSFPASYAHTWEVMNLQRAIPLLLALCITSARIPWVRATPCECPPEFPEEKALTRRKILADAVFHGKVVWFETLSPDPTGSPDFLEFVLIAVDRAWKGAPVTYELVLTRGTCGTEYRLGQDTMVFAKDGSSRTTPHGEFTSWTCGAPEVSLASAEASLGKAPSQIAWDGGTHRTSWDSLRGPAGLSRADMVHPFPGGTPPPPGPRRGTWLEFPTDSQNAWMRIHMLRAWLRRIRLPGRKRAELSERLEKQALRAESGIPNAYQKIDQFIRLVLSTRFPLR